MPVDDYTVSVTQNQTTDLANGRAWAYGAYVSTMAVYAPAAATNFEWSAFGDGTEQIPRGTQPVGTAPSATPAAEAKVVDYTAFGNWRMQCLHAGAAAQTIRVVVNYEAVVPADTEDALP